MTASLAGYLASAGAPMYCAAKHGIVGLMRAMKPELMKLNIAISAIAPGITKTPLLRANRESHSIEEWVARMKRYGIAINTVDIVGLATAYLINAGMKAKGMALLIQENQIAELESGIARTRKLWMGEEMLRLFRSERDAPLFSRI
jgi:NAD(P)-dependent dehydrogenase (short-subunit alcohol dehydrogenase family)